MIDHSLYIFLQKLTVNIHSSIDRRVASFLKGGSRLIQEMSTSKKKTFNFNFTVYPLIFNSSHGPIKVRGGGATQCLYNFFLGGGQPPRLRAFNVCILMFPTLCCLINLLYYYLNIALPYFLMLTKTAVKRYESNRNED